MQHVQHPLNRWLRLLALGASIVIGGCATNPISNNSASGSSVAKIDRWVSAELAPALVEQLANEPRFEGESVAIVKLKGSELDPAIDALTERVRQDLEDRLIKAGGISLIWQRPDSRSAGCSTVDDAGFFIGLETMQSGPDIAVRARMLDRRDNSWVPQISYQYRGAADATTREMFASVEADAKLQGTRLYPFRADENDLAAQQLARQLSCVVKKSRRSAVLQLQDLADEDQKLNTIYQLIGNYLQQQPGLELASSDDRSDYNIRVQKLKVDSEKSQLWLRPRMVDAEVPIEAVFAYLADAEAPVASAPVAQAPVAIAQPVPVPQTATAAIPAAQTPVTPVAGNTSVTTPLVDEFRAYTPAERSRCKTSDIWSGGSVALADSAALPSGACFKLRVKLAQPSHVFLVHESPDGALTRLLPDNCALADNQPIQVAREYWFPHQASGQVLDLDQQTGLENFHLLAMTDINQARQTFKALAGLPALRSNCAVGKGIVLRDVGVQGLRNRMQQDDADVQWQTRTLRHEAG